jgi:predicted amidohydrolase
MKICLAQTHPVTGNIQQNIEHHKTFVETAVSHQADLIIFPELSLTGYEPTLAQALAMPPSDPRLDIFQALADVGAITICVGLPTNSDPLPGISLLIFQPDQPWKLYTKQHLHSDEVPFFTAGPPATGLIGGQSKTALAICYELSVPEHADAAAENGADIYIASVAKFARGVQQAHQRLAQIAKQHHMTVLMVNCVGWADGDECSGGTAVWNREGVLVASLDDHNEGILVFDTDSQHSQTDLVTI